MARDTKRQSGVYGEQLFESHLDHYCDVIDYSDYIKRVENKDTVNIAIRQYPVPAPLTFNDKDVADFLLISPSSKCGVNVSNYESDRAGGCSDNLDSILVEVKNQNVGGSVHSKAFYSISKGKAGVHALSLNEVWLVILGVEWANALGKHYTRLCNHADFIEKEIWTSGHELFRCRVLRGPQEVGKAVRGFFKCQK